MGKRCSRCQSVKSIDEFFNSSRCKDGKDYYCKICRGAANKTRAYDPQKQAIYGARWGIKNPDKVKAKSKNQYWKDVVKSRARLEQWASEHPEARKAIVRRYNEKHPERVAERNSKRHPAYYAANKAKIIKKVRDWQIANPEKRKIVRERFYENNSAKIALQNRRYCKHRDMATPKWSEDFIMNEAYDLARLRTKVTGRAWVVDHTVPLNHKLVCGLHAHTNIQVILRSVNAIKSNHYWPDMAGSI